MPEGIHFEKQCRGARWGEKSLAWMNAWGWGRKEERVICFRPQKYGVTPARKLKT